MKKIIIPILLFLAFFAVVNSFGSIHDSAENKEESKKTIVDTTETVCNHENIYHYTEYSKYSADYHVVKEYCNDCKAFIGEQYESHTWINGICPDCLEGIEDE